MPTAYRKKNVLTEYDMAVRALDTDKDAITRYLYESEDDFDYRAELLEHLKYFRRFENFPEYSERFLKIKTKLKGIQPFKFNRAQRVFFYEYILPKLLNREEIRAYILKARQLGFSTLIEAMLFHSTSIFSDSNSLVVAHDQDKSAEIFEMTKLYYKGLPKNFRPSRKISNKYEIRYANPDEGGDLGLESVFGVDTARNTHLGASATYRNVHLSEFARYPSVNDNAELALATLYQTVPDGFPTMIFKETTGHGQGLGKEDWDNPDNGYLKVFVSWIADELYTADEPLDYKQISHTDNSKYGNEQLVQQHIIKELKFWYPETRDDNEWLTYESLKRLQWRRDSITKKSFSRIEFFQQEYPITPEEAFRATGNPVFNVYVLNELRREAERVPYKQYTYVPAKSRDEVGRFKEDFDGDLKIFIPPKSSRLYFIGADIGGGGDGDFSTAQILDHFRTQVAVYKARIQPDDFAYILKCLALIYRGAKINPEYNSMGVATINKLTKDLRYTNVYMRQSLDKIIDKITLQYGFYTSAKTRPIILNGLRERINQNELLIRDKETIDELLTFVLNKDHKMEAESGKKDDLVMGLALADHIVPKDIEDYFDKQNIVIPGSLAYYEGLLVTESNSMNKLHGW